MPALVEPYERLPNVGQMKSATDVVNAVSGAKDAPHRYAAVREYVQCKLRRNKTPQYVSSKLDAVELKVPQDSGDQFVEVREYFSLPPSRLFAKATAAAAANSDHGIAPPPYVGAEPVPTIQIPPPVPAPAVAGPSRSAAPSPAPLKMNGENALEMLRDYDTVFLIDDSSSMQGRRWNQALAAVKGVVGQAMKYDEDGIDVYFLNSERHGEGMKKPADVDKLFSGLQPRGVTPTGKRLEAILRDYMTKLEAAVFAGNPDSVPPMNLIVITDGAPTDDPESVIIAYAKRLDRGDFPLSQVGIQMVQVGSDPEATRALEELDDGLSAAHGIRDMVDTVPYKGDMTAELIIKVLLGGINRRLDRRK